MVDLAPEALRNHSKLFSLLAEAGQRRLLAVSAKESFAAGHAVVTEGERGGSFFLVVDGALSVRVNGIGEVATLTPGAFFGEIAALLGEARSATVVCTASTTLLRFDGPRVQGILTDYPLVRQALVKLGLKRSEDNLQQMIETDFPGVPVTTGEGPAVVSDES
jgi:CRP-like cAMP-binding protein